ncbi:hypothetical protein [Vibrio hepatarius]|uniref:hypothetical protein n=1 Tax=Vibrio hepatarius TaxID=171383 RepID=UPI00142DA7E0|nr:hypothetical protein [Vibrio hepatarius]NIY84588.1 hypothetical protein [Vibrio hepatarius]
MKLNRTTNAVSVYYPDRDSPVKYEIELSESGARKGMVIGGMIGSKIPHPIALPASIAIGGIFGAIWGKAD